MLNNSSYHIHPLSIITTYDSWKQPNWHNLVPRVFAQQGTNVAGRKTLGRGCPSYLCNENIPYLRSKISVHASRNHDGQIPGPWESFWQKYFISSEFEYSIREKIDFVTRLSPCSDSDLCCYRQHLLVSLWYIWILNQHAKHWSV